MDKKENEETKNDLSGDKKSTGFFIGIGSWNYFAAFLYHYHMLDKSGFERAGFI